MDSFSFIYDPEITIDNNRYKLIAKIFFHNRHFTSVFQRDFGNDNITTYFHDDMQNNGYAKEVSADSILQGEYVSALFYILL
jgi:hypothetical protein